ncbi:MAG TPA: hypothetical protein VK486_12790, partial [Thermoleophilaceae bacterium]|nr:hypothetical protein [Thermoleophilaceae bacterium]
DPLERHRAVLGDYTDELAARRLAYVPELRASETMLLRTRLAELRDPFAHRDVKEAARAALETRRLEDRRRALLDRINGALALAAAHGDEEERMGLLRLSGRRDERAAAKKQLDLVDKDRAKLAEVDGQLAAVRAKSQDFAAWMDKHGDDGALRTGIEHELATRQELHIANRIERALVDPPEHVLAELGDVPAKGTPERDEWEALVRETERVGVEAEIARYEGHELPGRGERAQRELNERVDRLRAQRNMEPLERALPIEAARDGPGFLDTG